MNDFLKGYGNAWLEFLVCIVLSSASVLAIEALTSQNADPAGSDCSSIELAKQHRFGGTVAEASGLGARGWMVQGDEA